MLSGRCTTPGLTAQPMGRRRNAATEYRRPAQPSRSWPSSPPSRSRASRPSPSATLRAARGPRPRYCHCGLTLAGNQSTALPRFGDAPPVLKKMSTFTLISAYPSASIYQVAVLRLRDAGAMENIGLSCSVRTCFDGPSRRRRGDKVKSHRCASSPRDGAYVVRQLVTMCWWDDLWLNEAFAEWIGPDKAIARQRAQLPHLGWNSAEDKVARYSTTHCRVRTPSTPPSPRQKKPLRCSTASPRSGLRAGDADTAEKHSGKSTSGPACSLYEAVPVAKCRRRRLMASTQRRPQGSDLSGPS